MILLSVSERVQLEIMESGASNLAITGIIIIGTPRQNNMSSIKLHVSYRYS